MPYDAKLLICEDNEALSSLMRFKLVRAGFKECIIADDGKKAKQLLQDQPFDLVITDIHMPFISGLELTTFIREELKSEIPIIILSSETVENTVLTGFELGINDFLPKPFSPNELIVRVKKILKI